MPVIRNGQRIYGIGGRNTKGVPENKAHCIEDVAEDDRKAILKQCRYNRGYGPDGLYCLRHARWHEVKLTIKT